MGARMTSEDAEDAKLVSRLLWESREVAEMLADVSERRSGKLDGALRRLVQEIDDYRADRGWSPSGFGSETATDGNRGDQG